MVSPFSVLLYIRYLVLGTKYRLTLYIHMINCIYNITHYLPLEFWIPQLSLASSTISIFGRHHPRCLRPWRSDQLANPWDDRRRERLSLEMSDCSDPDATTKAISLSLSRRRTSALLLTTVRRTRMYANTIVFKRTRIQIAIAWTLCIIFIYKCT